MNGYNLIDGNSLVYAAQSTQVLSVNGMEVQGIFQTLKMLKKAREKHQEFARYLWLWDGHAQFRYDLFPGYKGKREDTPEKVALKEGARTAKPYLNLALTHLGVNQVVAPDFEADDLAGYFTRKLTPSGVDVLLLSGDQDWVQLVNGKIRWYDPREKLEKQCTRASFRDFTGVDTAAQFLECKALTGDTSDTIPGVGGIGDKASALIMQHYGSVKNLMVEHRRVGAFTKENLPGDLTKFKKKLNDFCTGNVRQFVLNYKLMNLNDATRDETISKNAVVTRGKRDFDAFAELCTELQFHSILRDLKAWESLF